ncbi:putative periplasmic protein [hydrothermal vent metagenome]|uniref:Putative periplasmic protein n=1 Tax=hydrothermal vent metagenome TaxID=652676 RepID=A0A1W1B9A4_9ZZZZ
MKKLFILLLINAFLYGSTIQLIKKETPNPKVTLLVIGGIHGNEPGGYFSASILATHYKILSNALWVVPNLNQASIQANKRGLYGDMNRKFAHIRSNDHDKQIVEEIKKIILSPKVSLVLNLHDGHGFYRKKDEGSIFNPNAWGQTCVIDQCKLNGVKHFSNLDSIAQEVKNNINKKLIKKHHSFNVKNTNTKFDDEAMQKSLTFFAVTNHKPAFAIETSKNLTSLSQKVFYQLTAIEEFMNIMGIKFQRDFPLTISEIEKIIKDYGYLHINNNIIINLSDIKKTLRFIPLKSKNNIFSFTHPLGSVKKRKNGWFDIYIGNKRISRLMPQYFQIASRCPKTFAIVSKKERRLIQSASEFFVNDDFKIESIDTIRVNVIGYSGKKRDESNVTIRYRDLDKRYSIDRRNRIFRVEFYQDNKFCAMNLVHFKKGSN